MYFCNGELKKEEVEHKEMGVSLGKFPVLVCSKCKEVFFDESSVEKIQNKSKELGLFGLANY